MSYVDPGPVFRSKPTIKPYVPKEWLADGIRRSVDDQSLDAGTRFITLEDYHKMMTASETVALAMASDHYRRGKNAGYSLAFIIAICAGIVMALGGCSTARPKPLGPTGPVKTVSSRVQGVTVVGSAYLLVKFSDSRRAWPVRVVEEHELEKMVPGTQVLMAKVTDTASVAQEVRGPRPGEPTLNIMLVP